MIQQIPSELAEASVLDPDGKHHRLGDCWRKRPVVLVFIRHFG
ncbi:MAG: hypothetical protein AB1489_24475 [Acidobacteriota bacterium]